MARLTLSPVENRTPLDPETEAYFDACVPEYSVERLADTAQFISEHSNSDASLIDVGSGTGNTLVDRAKPAGSLTSLQSMSAPNA